jgi:hypothetical protein
MNYYFYTKIIDFLELKDLIKFSELSKSMNYLIKDSIYATKLWTRQLNRIRNEKCTYNKSPRQLFKLCAVHTFHNIKYGSERRLVEFFNFLTNKQIETYLKEYKSVCNCGKGYKSSINTENVCGIINDKTCVDKIRTCS